MARSRKCGAAGQCQATGKRRYRDKKEGLLVLHTAQTARHWAEVDGVETRRGARLSVLALPRLAHHLAGSLTGPRPSAMVTTGPRAAPESIAAVDAASSKRFEQPLVIGPPRRNGPVRPRTEQRVGAIETTKTRWRS